MIEPDTSAALSEFLERQINEFNFATTGIRDGQTIGFSVTEAGAVVAGISGWTWGGCLYVEYLWVGEAERGQGLGAALLARAEAEGVARGCTQALLETHSVQAPKFYAARGYEVIGEADGYPRGHSQLYLRKLLA
jgi:GNAT superfamily N-acetyltransferase